MAEFAAAHMERHGWAKGKGLGRNESGISEPIKVSIKADSTGVGHDASKQFTFHWWEHAFETASKNIEVKEEEDGVVLTAVDTCITTATNKIYKKSLTAKSMLYGRFVKSGILNNGLIEKSDSNNSSDESSDEDDSHRPLTKDLQMLTDEDLFNACGGRTAHKGARHGMKLSGKLARLAEQETNTTEVKISNKPRKKKKHKAMEQNSSAKATCTTNDKLTVSQSDITVRKKKSAKGKKNKNKNLNKLEGESAEINLNCTKKKKNKRKADKHEISAVSKRTEKDVPKKKKKRKGKLAET
uniref:G patch domain-containing protein 4 n=1 Tax=Phallusia mammillata TaxID=59560 RepID=A0A6F9DE47_9ASCI|nr:G patch domain-containing protein 4-like [Phallusia mammillata]